MSPGDLADWVDGLPTSAVSERTKGLVRDRVFGEHIDGEEFERALRNRCFEALGMHEGREARAVAKMFRNLVDAEALLADEDDKAIRVQRGEKFSIRV